MSTTAEKATSATVANKAEFPITLSTPNGRDEVVFASLNLGSAQHQDDPKEAPNVRILTGAELNLWRAELVKLEKEQDPRIAIEWA